MKKTSKYFLLFLLGLFLISTQADALWKCFEKNSTVSSSLDASDNSLLDEKEGLEDSGGKKITSLQFYLYFNAIPKSAPADLLLFIWSSIETTSGFKSSVYSPPK